RRARRASVRSRSRCALDRLVIDVLDEAVAGAEAPAAHHVELPADLDAGAFVEVVRDGHDALGAELGRALLAGAHGLVDLRLVGLVADDEHPIALGRVHAVADEDVRSRRPRTGLALLTAGRKVDLHDVRGDLDLVAGRIPHLLTRAVDAVGAVAVTLGVGRRAQGGHLR